MRIIIHQKALSIGEKYGITIDDQMAYRASSPPVTWSKKILIHAENSEEIVVTIKQRFDWFRQRYSINIDGDMLDFRTLSFENSQYQCLTNDGLYEIIAHKGRKYSVTKNFIQVAWWDKNLFTISRGDIYTIEADRDVNALLIIAFCLIMDTIDEKSNLFFFSPGRPGWGLPAFDENWRPKI